MINLGDKLKCISSLYSVDINKVNESEYTLITQDLLKDMITEYVKAGQTYVVVSDYGDEFKLLDIQANECFVPKHLLNTDNFEI